MPRESANSGTYSKVCVIGLGYIGLPTAVFLASAGYRVLGVDINPARVEAVNGGNLFIDEPGLDEIFRDAVRSGFLRAATQTAEADVFFICVPTPSRPSARYEGEEADLDAVRAAARSVAGALRAENLVVLESTVPPGTTEGPVRAILEESGLTVHRDGGNGAGGGSFYLAHCPERVIPDRIAHELVHNDRVVGGCSREAAERAASVYRAFARGKVTLTDAATAEMVKLMENTFRDVNIALANEFAVLCEGLGIDVWEGIRLANRHPRVNIHRPGPGVGGHCIPVDPWFIVEKAPDASPLIRQARRVNGIMPRRVADRTQAWLGRLGRPARVAVLGLTYKADVNDVRESPSLTVITELLARGIDVVAHDPHVTPERCAALFEPSGDSAPGDSAAEPPGAGRLTCAGNAVEAATEADLLLVLVPHRAFLEMDPVALRGRLRQPAVFDACGGLDPAAWRAAGFQVLRLGDGTQPATPHRPSSPETDGAEPLDPAAADADRCHAVAAVPAPAVLPNRGRTGA